MKLSTTSFQPPSLVIPVFGDMARPYEHAFALDLGNRSVEQLDVGALQEAGGVDEMITLLLSKTRLNLHFLIESPGGLLSVLDYFRSLISQVRSGGGKSYSYVPRYAASAAALLATETDHCLTSQGAAFTFHSAKLCALETTFEHSNILGTGLFVPIPVDQKIVELAEGPSPEMLQAHQDWVRRQFLGKNLKHFDRNDRLILERNLMRLMSAPGNDRGEFSISGQNLADFKRAKSFSGMRDLRRAVKAEVGFLPDCPNGTTVGFWGV